MLAWGPKPKPDIVLSWIGGRFQFWIWTKDKDSSKREEVGVNCWRRTLNLKGIFPSKSLGLVPTAVGEKTSTLASGGSQGCLSSRDIRAAGEDQGGLQDLGATRFHHENPNLCKNPQKVKPQIPQTLEERKCPQDYSSPLATWLDKETYMC